MANGFAPYILRDISQIAKSATPQNKIEMPGFLQSLLTAHSYNENNVKYDLMNGHFNAVQVKKKKRYTASQTETTPSCDSVNVNAYSEDSVSVANYRQLAVHIEDEVIAAYMKAASDPTKIGNTMVVEEFAIEMLLAANGLLSAVNSDLLTLAFAAVGVNRRTGLNTAATINIGKDTNFNSLTDGATQVMSDYKLNNMSGRPIAVGGGLFNNYIMQQAAKQAAQNGLDTRTQAGGFDFYYDNSVETVGDANDLLVYEKDAVQLITYLKYQGFKRRDTGENIFDNVKLPYTTMTANGGLQVAALPIDIHFKFNACEETFDVIGGGSETLQKGWNMILSSNFGLWTIPSGAYRSGDPLFGNRGSLLYNVTNDCDSCDGGY
jgi:hypothetical protein